MALTTQPFVMRDVSLTLVKKGAATPVEYRCQLSQAQLTPAAASGGGQTLETFCSTYSSSGSTAATWTLDLGGFQAYKDVTDLSIILFNDEGEEYTYTLLPEGGTISTTNPGFTGDVTLIPVQVGGTANQYATFTVSLPCLAKPTMLTTPPVGAREPLDDSGPAEGAVDAA